MRNYNDIKWYRTILLQLRYGMGLQNRSFMADILAKTIRESLKFPGLRIDDTEQLHYRVNELKQQGYVHLGSVLASEQVSAVFAHLQRAPLRDEANNNSQEFTAEDAPPDVNVGSMAGVRPLSNCPHVLEVANTPEILAAVEAFLGAPATVQYYDAWWSFAGRSLPRNAQFFHYDRNCFRFVKLFLYLTDVGINDGPHVYVKGSSDVGDWTRLLEEAKRKEPSKVRRYLEMINSVRKEDRDVLDFFGNNRVHSLTGLAGDAFLVDTSGIHKGMLPNLNHRLVFQATYALLPLLKDSPPPLNRNNLVETCLAENGAVVDRAHLNYVNRIAVT